MKKLLILIPLLFIFLLVGCDKKENKIDVEVVGYHTKIEVEDKTRVDKYYLIVVDTADNTYFLEVKKTWSWLISLEDTYPVGTILTVNTKDLIKATIVEVEE